MSEAQERDLERSREVAAYGVVAVAQPALENLARLAAAVTGRPVVMVNLMMLDTQATVASVGMDLAVCAREDSMCSSVLYREGPTEVRDARVETRWSDNPFVNGEQARFRFYYAHPLVSPRGVVIGTLCVFDVEPYVLDHTQRCALEEIARWIVDLLELRRRTRELETALAALTRTRDELQRSNQLLGAFASQVAHDLRGPITALNASLEMLSDEEPAMSLRQEWIVEHASSGVRRMDELVDEVLRMATPDAQLRLTHVDLQGLVLRVREDLAVELVGVRVDDLDLPVVVGDAVQLRIVMQNLLSNAAKFLRGVVGPAVAVSAGSDVDRWWLEVADNGPGVPAVDRERVFGLMEQGRGTPPTTPATDVSGLGLGLATCRRIVEAHGGHITIGATATGGALVRVVVPVTRAGLMSAAMAAAAAAPA